MVSPTGFAALQYAQTKTATAPAQGPSAQLGGAAEEFAKTLRDGEAAENEVRLSSLFPPRDTRVLDELRAMAMGGGP